MKKIDFHCLLTNASYPAQVLLTKDSISVEIRDFPCDFEVYSESQPVD